MTVVNLRTPQSDGFAVRALDIAACIKPMLAEVPTPVVGAIFAELFSQWLLQWVVTGSREETEALREELIEEFVTCVCALLAFHEERRQ